MLSKAVSKLEEHIDDSVKRCSFSEIGSWIQPWGSQEWVIIRNTVLCIAWRDTVPDMHTLLIECLCSKGWQLCVCGGRVGLDGRLEARSHSLAAPVATYRPVITNLPCRGSGIRLSCPAAPCTSSPAEPHKHQISVPS